MIFHVSSQLWAKIINFYFLPKIKKKAVVSQEAARDAEHLYRKLAYNARAMQWIETTLLANMEKLSKTL